MDVRQAVLDGPLHLRREWLDANDKMAVPFETNQHLDDEDAERLAGALAQQGKRQLHGVTTEPLDSRSEDGRVVLASPADLRRWSDEVGVFNAALIAEDLSLAVLFTVDEYGVVAGSRDFVEAFLGRSVEEGARIFRTYASDMTEASRHLPGVALRYLGSPPTTPPARRALRP